MEKFSIKEAIQFGWNLTKSNIGFFVKIILLIIAINLIFSFLDKIFTENIPLKILFNLISLAISIIITIGLTKISLNFLYGKPSSIKDLFIHYHFFFRFLAAGIIFSLIIFGIAVLFSLVMLFILFILNLPFVINLVIFVFLGILGLIVGINLAIRFQFFTYFIVDKNISSIESLRKSWQITKGLVWHLFIFNLTLLGIKILGLLALIIGIFWAIPTSLLASVFVYNKLLSRLEPQQPETSTPESPTN